MGFEFLIPIFGILVVLVPIIGVTTVLTLRYGVKPFVETLAAEMRGSGYAGSVELQAQIQDMGEQIATMAAELHRLREAQTFDQSLLGGAPPEDRSG